MRWEELTAGEFAKAVVATQGVVVVPVAVLEPHGAHLPLGTDLLIAHWTAIEAAKREPAIVHPPLPWGINHDAAHLPGAIIFKRDLCLAILDALCDELGRNGLKKIILLSGHGGNKFLLPLFAQTVVEKKPDYLVYYANLPYWPGHEKVVEEKECGHACEMETSTAMHCIPDLVKMQYLPREPFRKRNRHQHLDEVGAYTFYQWYANYPTMYVGDASKATAEKGRIVMEAHRDELVRLIRAVKADQVVPGLQEEFFRRWDAPEPAY